ncbi:50S ribosomal protein L20 [Tetrabaena socialis]|uniref:50S ribosomal protein L20 n=1 Tax=Tetrabaena socialis TaxID=47790 RepID=A0A2J7ZXC1_9CHLO|nr:50S ribosomal protein L20 [Tetrabaena socialis]|eukprot:PNH04902.1 50S ribosomal protein L20 [Tetrabaena socialis]
MPINRLKILQLASSFRGRARNCINIARLRVEKALQHAYIGRKLKKRHWRSVWIQRINAGTREHGVTYTSFITGLKAENVQLNRKVLSELAMNEPYSFKALVEQVKFMRGSSRGPA